MFIDTHAHLYSTQFDSDRADMLSRASAVGVDKIFLPNIDVDSIVAMHDLEQLSAGQCVAMMGLHPCSVKSDFRVQLEIMHSWLCRRSYCAIGEIGTDLYWDKSTFDLQQEAFIIQMGYGYEFGLPIVIHCRDSVKETLALIQANKSLITGGIFHCFSGDIADAWAAIEYGYYLGIGGPITYKKNKIQEIIKEIPLDKIVLETDAPYLPPVPHRGQRNESAYIPLIAEKIAEIKNINVAEVAEITSNNALRIFNKITG